MKMFFLLRFLLLPFFFTIVEGEGGGSGSGDQDPPADDKDKNPDSGNQGSGGGTGDPDPKTGDPDSGNSGNSIDSLPEWAQKEIKGLRQESAKHRTSNKDLSDRFTKLEGGLKQALGLETDDKSTPEEQISNLTDGLQQAEVQNAILGLAIENGIGQEDFEFFAFKMQNALGELKENEELSQDSFASIIQGVKGKGQGPANTSINDNGKTPDPTDGKGTTIDQFVNMTMGEKNALYKEQPDTYKALFSQAKSKGLLK